MKTACIIAEYNPFHKGHLYQIKKLKEKLNIDYIISIMSGSFVQRGLPALINKYDRAEAAIYGGVDLIVELPVYFSLRSAEAFARGAVNLARHMPLDYLVFGSESPLDYLLAIEEKLRDNQAFEDLLAEGLDKGKSYPAAYQIALNSLGFNRVLGSNDQLALEYLKALRNTSIKAYSIIRKGPGHLDENSQGSIASGSLIRKLIKEDKLKQASKFMPAQSFSILQDNLKNNFIADAEDFLPLIKYKALVDRAPFHNIISYENGMENLIGKALIKAKSFDSLVDMTSSKRYKKSRIQRFLFSYLLGLEKLDREKLNRDLYIRPLAFTNKGTDILANITGIKIVSKFADHYLGNSLLDLELKSSNLYNFPYNNEFNQDFYISPRKINP